MGETNFSSFISHEATFSEDSLASRDFSNRLPKHPATLYPMTTKPPLTDRQREVLDLWLEGVPYRTLADRLGISKETVNPHLKAIDSRGHKRWAGNTLGQRFNNHRAFSSVTQVQTRDVDSVQRPAFFVTDLPKRPWVYRGLKWPNSENPSSL